jgi:transcriptional regulator with XRE-family HTH domain
MKTISQMEPKPEARGRASTKIKLLVDLADLRHRRHISLREVEKEIGLSNAFLSQVENGMNLSLYAALKLAHFYEMPIESMWALNEDRKP